MADNLSVKTGKRHKLVVNTLTIRIDIDPEDAEYHNDRFRLFSDDLSFEQILSVRHDLQPGDGYLDLRYVCVPKGQPLTLEVDEGEDGEVYQLFQGKRLEELA